MESYNFELFCRNYEGTGMDREVLKKEFHRYLQDTTEAAEAIDVCRILKDYIRKIKLDPAIKELLESIASDFMLLQKITLVWEVNYRKKPVLIYNDYCELKTLEDFRNRAEEMDELFLSLMEISIEDEYRDDDRFYECEEPTT
jgi:hypothetical protein